MSVRLLPVTRILGMGTCEDVGTGEILCCGC